MYFSSERPVTDGLLGGANWAIRNLAGIALPDLVGQLYIGQFSFVEYFQLDGTWSSVPSNWA